MVVSQGEIWWADLPSPTGSGPGFRRPVVIVQGNAVNQSGIRTVICVPLTSNLKWGEAPGNVVLQSKVTGLAKDSVANVSQILTLDMDLLMEQVGRISNTRVQLILAGLDVVLGRSVR